jgi:hypothetical protein
MRKYQLGSATLVGTKIRQHLFEQYQSLAVRYGVAERGSMPNGNCALPGDFAGSHLVEKKL